MTIDLSNIYNEFVNNTRALLECIPGVVEGIDYSVSGKLNSIIYANGVETRYSYDPRQRLTHLETKNLIKQSEILQHLNYTLDGVSNITAIADGRNLPAYSPQNASRSFQYDDLYRLTSYIITAYEPDLKHFEPGFKTRRKK